MFVCIRIGVIQILKIARNTEIDSSFCIKRVNVDFTATGCILYIEHPIIIIMNGVNLILIIQTG